MHFGFFLPQQCIVHSASNTCVVNGVVTFCVTYFIQEIHMLRIRVISGRGNQSIEMSNFLRRALDFGWSQGFSLCDSPTLSPPSCKPFRDFRFPAHGGHVSCAKHRFLQEPNFMHVRFAQPRWQFNCEASPCWAHQLWLCHIDEHDTLGS